jgi:hypothetical protein
MKKVLLVLGLVAMVGVAQAVLIQDGDFETPGNIEVGAWGGATAFSAGDAGSDGAYGIIDGIAIMVLGQGPASPGVGPGLLPAGLSGGDTMTFTMDMIGITIGGQPGVKLEAWNSGGVISDTGDMRLDVTANWETYSWDYLLPAGTTHYKIVPLGDWGAGSTGFDNASIVPEPATMALLGLGALVLRRKK